ncbi:N-acetylglucosamine-6-phosphate deacetylase [Salinimonas lutimaris]|uniref:N-acetylglucosamine-6-phosphate deacetylase n=1 Tax=Salinimonas lutimaris TaxID=914153 RepID=UPI001C308222|nr:N-acetylglucosamine-6-phosphate deacetylase [Salinimonas lutimaris]
MMETLYARQLFNGYRMFSMVSVTLNNGIVTSLNTNVIPPPNAPVYELLCPAMIDTQVNGGGGVQFNHTPTPAALFTMLNAHQKTGTGALCPTLITDDIDVMRAGADAFALARKTQPHRLPGLHFEGPHLSAGKKGMHSFTHLRPVSDAEIELFTRQDLGQVIVTLAPDVVSPSQITQLTEAGVIVSLGHSEADYATATAALNAGAAGFTHLFNAMSALTSREPGMVGAALNHPHAFAGIIVDSIHVHPATAKPAIRLLGASRTMLVTDAMAPAASECTHFYYHDQKITRSGNTLTLANGTLAGSVLTMTEALKNSVEQLGLPIEQALLMATTTPARFLNKANSHGLIEEGRCADILALDQSLNLTHCWYDGQPVTPFKCKTAGIKS